MKIIGHRGAAGLALENTVASIRAAVKQGVDAIEFDVRATKDGHFILCHNATLKRVSNHKVAIAEEALATILDIPLTNGERPATLDAALKAAGDTPVIVEAKSSGWAEQLAAALKNADPTKTTIIARDYLELDKFHQLAPQHKIYLVQRFNPIDVLQAIRDAARIGCAGVDLNFWLLNPLTYWLARRKKLDIIVYTVDFAWIARFLAKLFPEISITTNHPAKMHFLKSSHASQTKLGTVL
jgi:glycerophosphoryl diester phosphodiesterase